MGILTSRVKPLSNNDLDAFETLTRQPLHDV